MLICLYNGKYLLYSCTTEESVKTRTGFWIAKQSYKNNWTACVVFFDGYNFHKLCNILMIAMSVLTLLTMTEKKVFKIISVCLQLLLYVTCKQVLVLLPKYYIQHIHQRVYFPEDNPNSHKNLFCNIKFSLKFIDQDIALNMNLPFLSILARHSGIFFFSVMYSIEE